MTGRSKKGFRCEVLRHFCNAFLVKKDDRKRRGLIGVETSQISKAPSTPLPFIFSYLETFFDSICLRSFLR